MGGINKLSSMLSESKNIVVFTGAGVSTKSQIPDFKSVDSDLIGLSREQILNIEYFKREPEQFWVYYDALFNPASLNTKIPNEIHNWISKLEDSYNVVVITQNIDGLHSKAGSSKVIELHGTHTSYSCLSCGSKFTQEDINSQLVYVESEKTFRLNYVAPKCNCGAVLKPDIVLFGEDVKDFDKASATINHADTLIVLGSRLEVAPANKLVHKFLKRKKTKERYTDRKYKAFIWNLDATPYDSLMDLAINEEF